MAGRQKNFDALHWLYAALQLEDTITRQLNFLALVRAWLLRYTHGTNYHLPLTSTTLDIDTLIDDAALAFLATFGPRLWPSDEGRRGHLLPDSYLRYELDFLLNEWKDARTEEWTGRPPVDLYSGRFSGVAGRQALRMYFAAVNGIAHQAGNEEGGREDGEVEDMDGLFAAVVGPAGTGA
ncbi:hypothetical protein LTR85_001986 [Meristemomyces frigidus]|nr:hypothetical protein LTR85_001986 [Meristemomyces frigidus]